MIPCTSGPASLRSATNEYSAFNPNPSAAYPTPTGGPAASSVGITIKAENVAVRNVTVLGFGTCYYSTQVMGVGADKRPVIDHLNGDCDTGVAVDQSPDATQFSGIDIVPFLTGHNGGESTLTTQVDDIADNGSGAYAALVEYPTDFQFANGDTVWINTSQTSGAESASGRWTVSGQVNADSDPSCMSGHCQRFTLAAPSGISGAIGSSSSPISATGNVSNVVTNGVPMTAITGVVGTKETLISVGQQVTDSSGCIPNPMGNPTRVVDVWEAKSIVYISASPTCSSAGDSLTFRDDSFTAGMHCDSHPANGCAIVDANIRFGDGVRVTNSGGLSIVNCQVFDHGIAYHMYTGANAVRIANCSTGDNVSLPDNAFVGLQIDGDHMTDNGDGCGIDWANGVLGQFRPVSVLVNSDCTRTNKFANVGIASSNARRNGTSLELDGGVVQLDSFGDTLRRFE